MTLWQHYLLAQGAAIGERRALLADVSGLCAAVARLGTSKDPVLLVPRFSRFSVHRLAMAMISGYSQSFIPMCNGRASYRMRINLKRYWKLHQVAADWGNHGSRVVPWLPDDEGQAMKVGKIIGRCGVSQQEKRVFKPSTKGSCEQ